MAQIRSLDIQLKHVHYDKLCSGIALIALGLLMPALLTVENLRIYPTLYLSLQEEESAYLIYAALRLVTLNSLRSLPHYLGAFLLGESFDLFINGKRSHFVRASVACAVIPLVYVFIDRVYHIHYDFGVPAIILIALLIMVEKADLNMVNLHKKVLMMAMLITSVQFFDVMPALKGLPFGRGETSGDIKVIAMFLHAEDFLQFIATLLFLFLLFGSILVCKLIIDENKLKTLYDYKEKAEQMRTAKKLQDMEERKHWEIRHLVHDLKTPLTAVQALTGVVKMGVEQSGDDQTVNYLTRMENNLQHMGAMISGILYEDQRSVINMDALMRAFLAQTSNMPYAEVLHIDNRYPKLYLEINEIRVIRALVNAVDNAYQALPNGRGEISLNISNCMMQEKEYACFQIHDNGKGIPSEQIELIWEDGFSTRSSSGLGLGYVKQVVELNHGTISLESVEGEGSTVLICLPTCEVCDG